MYMAPGMLQDVPPLPFLEAARDAGYQGVGLRLQKSPNLPIFPVVGDAPLVREIKSALSDSGLEFLDIWRSTFCPRPTCTSTSRHWHSARSWAPRTR